MKYKQGLPTYTPDPLCWFHLLLKICYMTITEPPPPPPVKRVPGSTPAIYLAGIRQVFHNDLFFNIYTIGLGTSFYNLLVPLHTNILYNTNQISQTSNIQLISIIFNKLRIMS